jgi:cytochrome P450
MTNRSVIFNGQPAHRVSPTLDPIFRPPIRRSQHHHPLPRAVRPSHQGADMSAESFPPAIPADSARSSTRLNPAASDGDDTFDLFLPLRSAGSLEDPYPIYNVIRTVRPVLEVPIPDWDGPGVWLLTRYADVHEVLRDLRFSADRSTAPLIQQNLDRMPEFLQQTTRGLRSMLIMDPPDHTRIRKLANKAFTRSRIERLRGHIEDLVRELLDAAQEKGRFDLIHDFAEPLPAIVIAELLGVPTSDHRQFREWSSALIASLGTQDAALREAGVAGMESILGYLRDIIAERRAAPRDDLISALITAQEEKDALSDLELLATSNLLLLAGHETTTNLIGNGMLALLREREEWGRLCADPSLAPSAVEELLRFDGPVQATVRVAHDDVELGGHVIPNGALVLVNIGAANHDPAMFEDPSRLDITRDPNPHLGFGFATHYCMGAPLARLEGALAFEALSQRMPALELLTERPEYRANPVLRGLRELEVAIA